MGQLKILELKGRAQKRLGASFDIKDYHSAILRDGALPLDILEEKINHWIDVRRGDSAAPGRRGSRK